MTSIATHEVKLTPAVLDYLRKHYPQETQTDLHRPNGERLAARVLLCPPRNKHPGPASLVLCYPWFLSDMFSV